MPKRITTPIFKEICRNRWKVEHKLLIARIKHARAFSQWKSEYLDLIQVLNEEESEETRRLFNEAYKR